MYLAVMSKKTYQFEVLRAGKFTDANGTEVEITQDDLNEMANGYDAENSPSPFVFGHPKDNDPAYGWADGFKVVGNKLIAFADNLHESVKSALKENLFKKISLSIFNPDSPANPVPGKKYVRHIGLLGAAAPAVSGLKPISFSSEDEHVIEFEFSADTEKGGVFKQIISKATGKDFDLSIINKRFDEMEATLKTMKSLTQKIIGDTDMPELTEEEVKQLQADLAAEQAKTKKLETNLSETASKARKAEIVSFCDQMVEDGKLAPAMKDQWVELMIGLPDTEIEFSEGKESLLEKVKSLLEQQAKVLDFTEKSKDDKEPKSPANFSAPKDQTIDQDRLAKLAEAEQYAKEHNVSLSEAAQAVGA